MTSQLRKSLGLVIIGGLLFLLGLGMTSGDAVSESQAAVGNVFTVVGILVAIAAALGAAINLLRS